MFSRRVFGGVPDTFKILLEYGPSHHDYEQGSQHSSTQQVRLPVAVASLEFEFNSEEGDLTVVERFAQKVSNLVLSRIEERVVARITLVAQEQQPAGQPTSSTPARLVSLKLSVACCLPSLRHLQVTRTTSSGTVGEPVLSALLKHCHLQGVWKLKGAEGFGNFWATCTEVANWESLRNLNLSYCALPLLPASISELGTLKILRLSHNKLAVLPPEVSKLQALEVLAADHNMLTALPGEGALNPKSPTLPPVGPQP